MQKMADLADTLPAEGPAAGGKGRGRQAKEVPLRQRLVESWEGKVCCGPPSLRRCNANLTFISVSVSLCLSLCLCLSLSVSLSLSLSPPPSLSVFLIFQHPPLFLC